MDKSIISHNKENDRVYLLKLKDENVLEVISEVEKIAKENNYTRILAKIPNYAKNTFLQNSYSVEAKIPKLYRGVEDGFFMSKFLSKERADKKDYHTIQEILQKSKDKINLYADKVNFLDRSFQITTAKREDAIALTSLYKRVFSSYPTPIHNPKFIEKTMNENIIYFNILKNNKIIASSSCEMDKDSLNVEMTDFATLPEYRAKGLAYNLLSYMEKTMKELGFKTAYSMVRAVSPGMNYTFAKAAYKFTGTLINSTNISGGIESMNIWYKNI